MLRRLYLLLALMALLVPGCDVSPGRHTSGAATPANGLLYVTTSTAILRFSDALSATGNVTPAGTISGSATQLSSPQHLLLDVSTDRLFVANQGASSILLFQTASTIAGDVSPNAVITSTSLATPIDIAIDTGFNNFLYVADGSNILVFAGQSSLTGTVHTLPVHTINTTLTIGAILLDAVNNRLFVADTAGDGVNILDNASTQTGTAVFTGRIAGPTTQLKHPDGLALDPTTGRLIVSNAGASSITIYPASAIPAGGDIAPFASITGSLTKLASPGQIQLNSNSTTSELFVADSLAAAILTYTNVGTLSLNDNLPPKRTISGAGTGLNNTIGGMALDATRK